MLFTLFEPHDDIKKLVILRHLHDWRILSKRSETEHAEGIRGSASNLLFVTGDETGVSCIIFPNLLQESLVSSSPNIRLSTPRAKSVFAYTFAAHAPATLPCSKERIGRNRRSLCQAKWSRRRRDRIIQRASSTVATILEHLNTVLRPPPPLQRLPPYLIHRLTQVRTKGEVQ